MNEFKLAHHNIIRSVLKNFNADFFFANSIFFGGGTRIALEIDEYRESVDVDFLCPHRESYRAVRQEVTSDSLGALVKQDFNYVREIRFDRNAVRTFIDIEGTKVKLEIVSFDNYELQGDTRDLFPVPFINRETCFYTKLLANSDRCLVDQCKDIFDILAMYDAWNGIPAGAIKNAEKHYGAAILRDLRRSLDDVQAHKKKYLKLAESMLIEPPFAAHLIEVVAKKLLKSL